jgi:glycosyltransferase involved in cell wall biosynthesis
MSTEIRQVRVAIVCSTLKLAGAEKQTVYMARALREAGIDVRFFYLGPGGYYERVLRAWGIRLRRIYMEGKPWLMLAKLTGVLCAWRPHIVLTPQFGDLVYGIAGRFCKALTLGGVRSDGLHDVNPHGWRSQAVFRMAHGFVANSHRARQNLISRGVNAARIEVLPNVIDLDDFDSRSALSEPRKSKRILMAAIGRLHSCKRFDRFIEALALARRAEPALAGVIVGADCGMKDSLQAKADSLGLTGDDLTFVGECREVPALLAQAELLVLTSDYEGFPNVILEAMAAGLPVITTPAGDAGLIVQHGKTGYVVEPEDIQSIANHMIRLARSAELRMEFGEAGRQRVEREYNYELLASRLLGIFQRFAMQEGRASLAELLASSMRETEIRDSLTLCAT